MRAWVAGHVTFCAVKEEVGQVQIAGGASLVTGANRGLGAAFVRAIADRGAKVYAGARDPATINEPGVSAVRLDVTSPTAIAAAAQRCPDVNLVVNNAGVVCNTTFLGAPSLDQARREMEVNYFGPLAVTRAFAPVLADNGGGAVINVLSIVSFFNFPSSASQAASKAAAWSMTNGLRMELRDQGTLVVALHAGFIETGPTGMAAGFNGPKLAAADVVAQALDAVETGQEEVLVDDRTRFMKASLPDDLKLIYPDVEKQWRAFLTR